MARSLTRLTYTLLGDGSSDRALMPVLEWLLGQLAGSLPIEGAWADTGLAPHKLENLREKMEFALDFFPSDILFVHRDAESQPPNFRHEEISGAGDPLVNLLLVRPTQLVAVVPVRMMESWLLIDENAIRFGAGNPNGLNRLTLPRLKTLEKLDSKKVLHELVIQASGLQGRHLKKLDVTHSVQRVSEAIKDFSPLFKLSSFQRLQSDLRAALHQLRYLD